MTTYQININDFEKVFKSLEVAREYMNNIGLHFSQVHNEQMAEEWQDTEGHKFYITYWD